jgi:hypothetical protein
MMSDLKNSVNSWFVLRLNFQLKVFVFLCLVFLQVTLMLILSFYSLKSNNSIIKNRILNEWEYTFNQAPLERYTLCFSSQIQSAENGDLSTIGNALMNYVAFPGEPCQALRDFSSSSNSMEKPTGDYSKQWVGTNIISRLLLNFINLSSLQYLVFAGFIVSVLLLYDFFSREFGKLIGTLFIFFTLLYFDVPTWISNISYSMLFSVCFMASFFVKKIYNSHNSYVFYSTIFFIGMWLNFFDLFLTSAFLTMMIVAFPTFLQSLKKTLPFVQNARIVIYFLTSILSGYVFTWLIKWVLTYIFGDKTAVLSSVKGTLISRTSRNSFIEGVEADWFSIVYNTFKYLQSRPMDGNLFIILIVLNFILIIYFTLTNPKKFFNQSPFYIFTLLPFAFFYLLANWSSIHTFISYRALVFSLIFVSALNLLYYKTEKPKLFNKPYKNLP